jgi:hypothetical protein
MLIPEAANICHQCPYSLMLLAERECAWLQQRQRESWIRAAGSGEHDTQATIGMPHEVSAIAHDLSDVVGINQEVLALSRRAAPITPPVRYQQTKAFFSERSLSLPLVGSCR